MYSDLCGVCGLSESVLQIFSSHIYSSIVIDSQLFCSGRTHFTSFEHSFQFRRERKVLLEDQQTESDECISSQRYTFEPFRSVFMHFKAHKCKQRKCSALKHYLEDNIMTTVVSQRCFDHLMLI